MLTINTKRNWDKKKQHGDRPTSTLNLSSELSWRLACPLESGIYDTNHLLHPSGNNEGECRNYRTLDHQ